MVAPASRRISRVRRYSRSARTRRAPAVAYGALTRSGGPFQGLRLTRRCSRARRPAAPSSRLVQPPAGIGRQAMHAGGFGLLPVSLAATPGILSVPRGTEMFQFPRCPPGAIAPAVHRLITAAGCPIRTPPDRRLPARSPGHFAAWPRPSSAADAKASTGCPSIAASPTVAPGARSGAPTTRPLPAGTTSLRRATPRPRSRSLMSVQPRQGASLVPRPPGGAAGIRTPDLRRARAALSQLSYGPRTAARPAPTVGAPGLEPGTSALSGPRSDQLSYAPTRRPRRRGRRRRPMQRRGRSAPRLAPAQAARDRQTARAPPPPRHAWRPCQRSTARDGTPRARRPPMPASPPA